MGDARAAQLEAKEAAMARGHASLQAFALPNSEWAARGFGVKSNGELRTAATMLTVPAHVKKKRRELSSHRLRPVRPPARPASARSGSP